MHKLLSTFMSKPLNYILQPTFPALPHHQTRLQHPSLTSPRQLLPHPHLNSRLTQILVNRPTNCLPERQGQQAVIHKVYLQHALVVGVAIPRHKWAKVQQERHPFHLVGSLIGVVDSHAVIQGLPAKNKCCIEFEVFTSLKISSLRICFKYLYTT